MLGVKEHVTLVDLDAIARQGSTDGRRFVHGRYDKVLADIARRRAAPQLATYAQEQQEFLSLLSEDMDSVANFSEDVIPVLSQGWRRWRTPTLVTRIGLPKPGRWRASLEATRWRELEILINRDRNRQQELFEEPLTNADIKTRSNSGLREGAALNVALEFKLPYYSGAAMVVRLGSHNAHQFLNVCGDLFCGDARRCQPGEATAT